MIKVAGAGPGHRGVCWVSTSASPGPAALGGEAGPGHSRDLKVSVSRTGQVCEGSMRAGK